MCSVIQPNSTAEGMRGAINRSINQSVSEVLWWDSSAVQGRISSSALLAKAQPFNGKTLDYWQILPLKSCLREARDTAASSQQVVPTAADASCAQSWHSVLGDPSPG